MAKMKKKYIWWCLSLIILMLAFLGTAKLFNEKKQYIIDIPIHKINAIRVNYYFDEDCYCIVEIKKESEIWKGFIDYFSGEYRTISASNYSKGPAFVELTLEDATAITIPMIILEGYEKTYYCLEYKGVLYELVDPHNPTFSGRELCSQGTNFLYGLLRFAIVGTGAFDTIQEDHYFEYLKTNLSIVTVGTVNIPIHYCSGISSSLSNALDKAEYCFIGQVLTKPTEYEGSVEVDFPEDYVKLGTDRVQVRVISFVSVNDQGEIYPMKDQTKGQLSVGDLLTVNGPFGIREEKYTLGLSQVFLEEEEKYLFLIRDEYPKGLIPEYKYWLADRSYGVLKVNDDMIQTLFNAYLP